MATLHSATEALAALLSEVTVGDLALPIKGTSWDVGDLYRHLVDENLGMVAAIRGEPPPEGSWHELPSRAELAHFADPHGGCGLERGYRLTARLVEGAFASVKVDGGPGQPATAVDLCALHEQMVDRTVIHTRRLAEALGFAYPCQ